MQRPELPTRVQVTSGARSDFQQATREARHMVTECGMSEDIGPVFVENTESPDMRRRIDGEISRILREAYGRVKALLVSCLATRISEGDTSASAGAAGRAEDAASEIWSRMAADEAIVALIPAVPAKKALQCLCMPR